jgi:Restriction endonuclease
MSPSRYDELHDRFFSILSSKEGTRYERLAAVVFKTLHEQQIVVHDFRLRGDSTVKHQIDVLVEVDGKQKRVLIECKDFDKKGKSVGLGILRDFRSVVEDTNADEAFVLTCTGYTKPARKYAKAKGIKLAVLRAFEDRDWEGRIKHVSVDLYIQVPPTVERVDMGFGTAEEAAAFSKEAAVAGIPFPKCLKESPVFFVSDTEQVQIIEYIERQATKIPVPSSPTSHEVSIDPAAWQIRIGSHAPRAFTLFKIIFRACPHIRQRIEVGIDRVAELILQGFGDNDIIIFADQLQRARIDEEGRVTYESGAPARRAARQMPG